MVKKLGISACLLGEPVRYDGGHKLDQRLRDFFLGHGVTFLPICPEVGCGLSVPREPMRLIGRPGEKPRLVTIETGLDRTARLVSWIEREMDDLRRENVSGLVLKSRSPSCGIRDVPIFPPDGGPPRMGAGLFSFALMETFPDLPVADEEMLKNPSIREAFLEKIPTP